MTLAELQALVAESKGEGEQIEFKNGNTTSRMPQAEYQRRLLGRMATPFRWEDIPAGRFKPADLDTGEIERMLDAAVACGRLERRPESIPEALDKLKLRVDGQLTSAAAVLFAKDPFPSYPQCGIRMARFRGTSKLNDFIDQRQVTGHAFRLLEEAELFLNRHIAIAGTFRPDRWERQDRPEYPPLALREALVNALCHRDYSIVGGAIYVAIFDDRLEIISMGTLPPGITVDQLKQPHTSVQRNPAIADVFFRRGLIEKWGRGTQRIVEMCLAGGYPEPDFLEESGMVTVRFPRSSYAPPAQVKHDLTDRQREILRALADGRKRSFREIFEQLSGKPAKRTVQVELRMLRDLKLVELAGHGGSARWWLRRNDG
jgi:ATP-dependent DNA helicase RecG